MKKILFVTGLLAILAGCTKETLSPDAATARGEIMRNA